MKKQRVLMTLLEANEGLARLIGQELADLGVDVSAHFFASSSDALGQLLLELSHPEVALWLVVGESRHFNDEQTRCALSLVALGVQAEKEHLLPLVFAPSGGELATLPPPLSHAKIAAKAVAAKVVARLQAAPAAKPAEDYRLAVHAPVGLGLWLEVGPVRDPWHGVLLGTSGADEQGKAVTPVAHGVGLKGRIPENSTLNYPIKDMKLEARGESFTAWGVKNELTADRAYFQKISALPRGLVFGSFPDDDQPELFVLPLL